LLIALVATARNTRDPQRQWRIVPTLGHIGCHGYLSILRKPGHVLEAALQALCIAKLLYPVFA